MCCKWTLFQAQSFQSSIVNNSDQSHYEQVLPDASDQQTRHRIHRSRNLCMGNVSKKMLGLLPGGRLLQEAVWRRRRKFLELEQGLIKSFSPPYNNKYIHVEHRENDRKYSKLFFATQSLREVILIEIIVNVVLRWTSSIVKGKTTVQCSDRFKVEASGWILTI